MSQQQEPDKRIVSKSQYVWMCGIYGARLSASLVLGMLMVLFSMSAVTLLMCLPFLILIALCGGMSYTIPAAAFLLALVFGAMAVLTHKWADHLLSSADSMPSVTPLTRANTADLPALESLVRASEEPVQAQDTVLLRAAAANKDSHAEHEKQLLKASAGGQESVRRRHKKQS